MQSRELVGQSFDGAGAEDDAPWVGIVFKWLHIGIKSIDRFRV